MCDASREPQMAGIHSGHLPLLKQAAPFVPDEIESIFAGLSANLNPRLPVLAALVAMVESAKRQDFGVLSDFNLVRLPLSLIGEDKVRYRTPVVEMLHETVLSMRMSELAVETLRAHLRQHGLCITFLCCCGVVMGRCEDVQAYYGSHKHREMECLRSAIDAQGNPVQSVTAFDEIPVQTMDLHINGAEQRLFERIEALIEIASEAGHANYSWIDNALAGFVAIAATEDSVHSIAV